MDRGRLEKFATRLFSLYIRTKDADGYGRVRCFTCMRRRHYSEMHCGHFASRKNMCTKFLEINNHVQCPTCNVSYDGNMSNYRRNLDRTYGKGTADYIEDLARKTCKYTKSDLIDLITTIEKKMYGEEEA